MAEIVIRISDRSLRAIRLLLIGIALAIGVLVTSRSGVLIPKYRLRAYFPDATGLRIGTAVRLDGPSIGTIERIDRLPDKGTSERRIELILKIEKRYRNEIRSDSAVSLVTEGLLGSRYVNIVPGFEGSSIPDGGEIRSLPTRTIGLEDFPKILNCLSQVAGQPAEKAETHH